MSPRVITIPLSGGDRKHYAKQLRMAERAHESLVKRLAEAEIVATDYARMRDRLFCEEWSTRQFIGGDVEPSPTIAQAIGSDCVFLQVECGACTHSHSVNLEDVIWPRDKPIHTLGKALVCGSCGRKRSNLTGLIARDPDDSQPMRARKRRDV